MRMSIPFLCLLGLAVLFASPLGAQEKPDFARAERLLALDVAGVKEEIARLSAEDAAVLISQVRFVAAKRNPDLDKAYYVLEHLEALKATALAQRRLNNLLIVLGGTLVLFSGFLLLVNYDQRRLIRRLEKVAGARKEPAEKERKVFRGEA